MAIVCRHSAEAQPVMGNLIGVFGDARLSPTRKQNVKNRLQIGLRAIPSIPPPCLNWT